MAGSDSSFRIAALDNGWTVGKFDAIELTGAFAHLVTTRSGPAPMLVRRDRAAAAAELSQVMGLRDISYCEQVHGRRVIAVSSGGPAGQGDGLVTNVPSLGLMGVSADCPLILVADPITSAVGMAHASWRGTANRIASELVSSMAGHFNARLEQLVACICPSAGPCCYEIGQDVFDAAVGGIGPQAAGFFQRRGGKMYFDLWAANAEDLVRSGVRPQNVHIAGLCTICRNDIFPSHRAEGESAGRFAAVIASL